MLNNTLRAGTAGAASRYGSGSGSDQMMRLLAAPAPQHFKFRKETLDVFVIKTEVEFKNIKFAFIYINDPFSKNLCLKKWQDFFQN
jgi:hypothetical protein